MNNRLLASAAVIAAIVIGGTFLSGSDGELIYLSAPVERGDVAVTVTATGTVTAVVTVKVGSQLSGQIADLLVDFNDEVAAGAPIARLDDTGFQARVRQMQADLAIAEAGVMQHEAALDRARADLLNAEASRGVIEGQLTSAQADFDKTDTDYQRKKTLSERRTISQSELESAAAVRRGAAGDLSAAHAELKVQDARIAGARAAVRMAEAALADALALVAQKQAALAQAEHDLARTVIRAPIDGIVIGRDVEPGQTVAASLEAPTLFTIAHDLRDMEVHARVDEADIGRIQLGQRADFRVDAYPGRAFTGTVAQIRKAPIVIQNVVTYTVVISVRNEDRTLLPGMTALVRLVVDERKDVLAVPNAALRFDPADGESRPQGDVVWVLDEEDPTPRLVTTGLSDGALTEIVDGDLSPGELIAVGARQVNDSGGLFGLRFGF